MYLFKLCFEEKHLKDQMLYLVPVILQMQLFPPVFFKYLQEKGLRNHECPFFKKKRACISWGLKSVWREVVGQGVSQHNVNHLIVRTLDWDFGC